MGRGTKSKTLADLLPRAVQKYGPTPAIRFKQGDEWVDRSYAEVGEAVQALALGLIDLGVAPGDKVSILGNTRPEWTYADFAALSVGATVVPIYQTNSPEECQYVLENSDAKVVVVEDDEQLEKIRAIRAKLPLLEQVVRMTGASDDAISFEELAARGSARANPAEWEARWQAVTPDDICTFIYTSGTTGPPKGCVISHGNYRAMLDMVNDAAVIEDDDLAYLYLPLAHSFALLIQLGSFDLGSTLAYWERDPLKILPNLAELKPTYFPSVPRIFEKIYTAATGGMEKEGGLKKAVFNWSIKVGRRMREAERSGRRPGFLLRRQYRFADEKVLSQIRGLFGGRIRLAVSGAAPINPEILSFFDAAGVLVLEGWGMTETSTAATISSAEDFKVARSANRSRVARSRSPMTARSWSRARTSSRATTRTRPRPGRRSSTAGCTPATSARSTRTGSSRSPAARRTSSSPPGARTSPPRTSRTKSSSTRSSPSASSSATAGPTWSPWSPSTPKTPSPTPRSTASPRTSKSSLPTSRCARRSKTTSRRSTRNSPGSSRSRRSRSSPRTSPRRAAS